jgi:hypothetical protein
MARMLLTLGIAATLAGCAGKIGYVRPTANMPPGANQTVLNKPRDAVWNAVVPELGKRFFVINNLDKSSGLINISYSSDPQRYIDCGRVTSYVKNARGERTYDFPAAQAYTQYEVMNNGNLMFIERRMALDGRVNLVFEEIGPNQTRVTANTRYVVNRSRNVQHAAGGVRALNDSVTFNSGGSATYPGEESQAATCVPTGELEREILSALR